MTRVSLVSESPKPITYLKHDLKIYLSLEQQRIPVIKPFPVRPDTSSALREYRANYCEMSKFTEERSRSPPTTTQHFQNTAPTPTSVNSPTTSSKTPRPSPYMIRTSPTTSSKTPRSSPYTTRTSHTTSVNIICHSSPTPNYTFKSSSSSDFTSTPNSTSNSSQSPYVTSNNTPNYTFNSRPNPDFTLTSISNSISNSTTNHLMPKRKRKHERHGISESQSMVLMCWFNQYTYLTSERRKEVSKETGLPEKSVMYWFQNQRRRVKRSRVNNGDNGDIV